MFNVKETASTILYGYDKHLEQEAVTDLENYFQLNEVSLEACYKRWSKIDANFAKKAIHFQGIRMLRQDPWENLISFICSSNNNIKRISQMVKYKPKEDQMFPNDQVFFTCFRSISFVFDLVTRWLY